LAIVLDVSKYPIELHMKVLTGDEDSVESFAVGTRRHYRKRYRIASAPQDGHRWYFQLAMVTRYSVS
jgi:hypothetical protein